MSEIEKGEFLMRLSTLPMQQKERALGFLMGLVAAYSDKPKEDAVMADIPQDAAVNG